MPAAQQFRLIVDRLAPSGRSPEMPPIEVPPGMSYLRMSGGQPYLEADPGGDAALVPVVEPVRSGQQSYLLLVSPSGKRLRVNGALAARLSLLTVKDQVQIDEEHVLHVTLHHSPYLGPPPQEALGTECPVCRTPFSEQAVVYLCHGCGQPLHHSGPEGLECVQLSSECPVCHSAVVMKEGYDYYPEL